MIRARHGPLATTLVALFLSVSASAALLELDDSQVVTYYLHSSSPLGNAHALADGNSEVRVEPVDVAVEGLAAWMDEDAPVNAWPKAASTSGIGNPEFRRNFLLMYWLGDAQGHVSGAQATLWLATAQPVEVLVTLFGDGGIGVEGAFARASARVEPGAPQPVLFDFGDAAANVREQLALSVSTRSFTDPGLVILYDGAAHASSLTFTLGPFVDPDPPSPILPAAGWGNVSLINATSAHRETSLALSPTDPSLMVACAPSGVPNTEHGQSYFHVSRDGGATWEFMDVETGSSDPRRFAFEGGDCDVAFDAAGTMYSADTWLGSLSVGASRDGGRNWTGTSLAASAPVVDRPWLVGGPAGTLHVTWQDVQALMPSVIWYSRSTDHGLTFTPAVPVASANELGAFTWTGNFVVTPDQQRLYSVFTRRAGPAVGDLDAMGPETVWVAASRDGGATWSHHLVASMPNPASYLYPSIGMDEGGSLHVVFSSKTDVDRPIWYARSDDGALTWSDPMPILRGVSAWSPWVVGGKPGEAAIQWYGSPDPQANLDADFDWYFYAARVQDGAILHAGTTTDTPVFSGTTAMPEFNQVRLDAEGKMHIGASAYRTREGETGWALYHQRET